MQKLPVDERIAQQMLERAKAALKNTYPEAGNGFAVCVLTKAGNIYEGVSYQSDTQTLTMHSEATALAIAATHGEKDIVAITGPNCHICKQLIWESAVRSRIDVQIILEEDGKLKFVPISEMMPYPWPDADSNH